VFSAAASWLLASLLMVYAVPKFFAYQFVVWEWVRECKLRQIRPFDLAWAFFGHSYEYGLFLGLAEVAVCLLVVIPATRTLGALLGVIVLGNVVFIDVVFGIYGPLGMAILLFSLALGLVLIDLARIIVAVRVLLKPANALRIWGWSIRVAALALLFLLVAREVVTLRRDHDLHLRGRWELCEYIVSGQEQELTGGDKVREPMLFIELAGVTFFCFDGRDQEGFCELEEAGRQLHWTPDHSRPDEIFVADCELSGDHLILAGMHRERDLKILLQRASQ
jgi:hypothetical protein